MEGRKTVIDNI